MLVLLVLILLNAPSLAAVNKALRDPFYSIHQSASCVHTSTLKRSNKSVGDAMNGWQVKQVNDETVVLQDKDGAIREVSFTTTDNNKKNVEKISPST